MSRERSEEMMRLLQELSVYKKMDAEDAGLPTDVARTDAQEQRARRRTEIAEEMQRLADESKTGSS